MVNLLKDLADFAMPDHTTPGDRKPGTQCWCLGDCRPALNVYYLKKHLLEGETPIKHSI